MCARRDVTGDDRGRRQRCVALSVVRELALVARRLRVLTCLQALASASGWPSRHGLESSRLPERSRPSTLTLAWCLVASQHPRLSHACADWLLYVAGEAFLCPWLCVSSSRHTGAASGGAPSTSLVCEALWKDLSLSVLLIAPTSCPLAQHPGHGHLQSDVQAWVHLAACVLPRRVEAGRS